MSLSIYTKINDKNKNGGKMVEGRCMKCKKQVEMKDPKETATSRGVKMFKGKCPECGTTVCRIAGK